MINRYKSAALLKDSAKGYLNGKYKRAVLLTLVYAVIAYTIATVFGSVSDGIDLLAGKAGLSETAGDVLDLVSYYVIGILSSAFAGIMMEGMSLFYLKAGTGQMPAVSDNFAGFRENFGRNFLIALTVTAPSYLCTLPYYVVKLAEDVSENPGTYFTAAKAIVFVLGLIASIYLEICLANAFFIMWDFPEYTAAEVIDASFKKIEGSKGRYLGMAISFIPLILLTVLTLGIALLWLIPYMYETRALFYLDLMNPKKVSGEWERTV